VLNMKTIAALAAAVLVVLATAAPASAHVTQRVGPFQVEMGWGEEPPRVGVENWVEVTVAEAGGAAVEVPAGALSVEVTFGDAAITLPLDPGPTPGTVEAPLTPTRPGAYGFDVSGSLEGRPVEAGATCSDSTFECVESSAATEFPVSDPSAGELAQRLRSEAARLDEAEDDALGARRLAVGALVLAAAALAVAVAATRRRRG
jgi:hypothetical protein